ncbi:HAMP domain-containing protein [Rhodobacteraceae bacterium NNCM2]|nr:HAMP domain-containing protein [Coraliihabitans acroporae]
MSAPRGIIALNNATSRLIAAHLALVAVSTALILGFIYWSAGGTVDEETKRVVEAELQGLEDGYRAQGPAGLAQVIERRIRADREGDAVYLFTDASGRPIAGNLRSWPANVAPDDGWVTLSLFRTDTGAETTISAIAFTLGTGDRLLVGRDVAARAAFDQTLLRALLWALIAMTTLTLITGWMLSRLVLSRIDEVGKTAREISTGALDRRVALRGTGDEFDRLAETLNAMLDRNEKLVSDLRMVTDSLSHDLRTPLSRLSTALEQVGDEEMSAEERGALIAAARTEVEGLLEMLALLLEISRAEAGIGSDQFVPVDLSEMAGELVSLYAAVGEEKGIDIRARVEPDVVVPGHPQILANAVTNLVENALRHAADGKEIVVTVRKEGGASLLSIADRGPGIAPGQHEAVVQRFYQVDESRRKGGAGLGLALVAAVARLHRAELELSDNMPGLVATLRFHAVGTGEGD